MTQVAVYGTLRDRDVLQSVLGCDPKPWFKGTATLHDWAAYFVEGTAYPALRREHKAATALDLYENLPQDLWQKLREFEGDQYRLAGVKVMGTTYALFVAAPGLRLSPQPWSLELFKNSFKSAFILEHNL